jgi:hypothetical protein
LARHSFLAVLDELERANPVSGVDWLDIAVASH